MTVHELRDLVDHNFQQAKEKIYQRNFVEVSMLIRVKIDDYQFREKSRSNTKEELLNNLPISFYALRSLLEPVNPHRNYNKALIKMLNTYD